MVIRSRSDLYHIPELTEVAGNGGSIINQKTQQLLRKLVAVANVGGGDLVGDAVGKGKGSPKKGKGKRPEITAGKRKRAKIGSEEEQDCEEVKAEV